MDELTAVRQLLAEAPPGPEAVEAARMRLERAALGGAPPRTRGADQVGRAPDLVRRGAAPHRWPGWLTPVAAAAAVVAVIAGSLGISSVIRHQRAGTGPAAPRGALAKVPRYFVAVSEGSGRAVVAATASGTVLGTVAPPKPYTSFMWVAAAGDDRTFVLATGVQSADGTSAMDWGPAKFFRLVLDRSGHPGRLSPLPMPLEAGVSGVALSPDGSKLAVSLANQAHLYTGSEIQVFSLATGAEREWTWAGRGLIGTSDTLGPNSSPGAWTADNRTLLIQVTNHTKDGFPAQLRLLDTATSGGSLQAASTQIPIRPAYVGMRDSNENRRTRIIDVPLITGDGSTLITSFFHSHPRPEMNGFTITEFSVRTGQPTHVLYQRRDASDAGSTAEWWVNNSGSAVIASRGPTFGVQTPGSFTPLPPRTQRLFERDGNFSRLPVW